MPIHDRIAATRVIHTTGPQEMEMENPVRLAVSPLATSTSARSAAKTTVLRSAFVSVIIREKMSMLCEVIHKDAMPPIKDKPHTVKEERIRIIIKQRHVVL
jgi:hypothetical protein